MHIMNLDLASEVSTAAQTASSGSNSTASPVNVVVLDQQPNRENPATAESGETADTADCSSRSLKLRKAFSRGSFFGSIRSSIRSSFASGNLSDDDSLEAEHHGSDDLQQRSSGRRRSGWHKKRFSMSRRSSAFSSRSSIGSSGTGGGRSKRSHVNRKSSLDLIRGSEGQYRPRAEHPLLSDHPSAEEKSKRRGSFLGVAMRKLSMNGSPARNSFRRTKSSGNLASRTRPSTSPLSSSDHPPPRKGSFFGSFRRGSDEEAFRMNLSNHV